MIQIGKNKTVESPKNHYIKILEGIYDAAVQHYSKHGNDEFPLSMMLVLNISPREMQDKVEYFEKYFINKDGESNDEASQMLNIIKQYIKFIDQEAVKMGENKIGSEVEGQVLVFKAASDMDKNTIAAFLTAISGFSFVEGVGIVSESRAVEISQKKGEEPSEEVLKAVEEYQNGGYPDGLANPIFDDVRIDMFTTVLSCAEGDYFMKATVDGGYVVDDTREIMPPGKDLGATGGTFTSMYAKNATLEPIIEDIPTVSAIKDAVLDNVPVPFNMIMAIDLLIAVSKRREKMEKMERMERGE